MITREEFLKALEIVNNYKTQVAQQLIEVNKLINENDSRLITITKDTPITEAGLSTRALKALRKYSEKNEEITTLKWYGEGPKATLGDLEGLKKSDLSRLWFVGKKTMDEIEKTFFEAGIVLV